MKLLIYEVLLDFPGAVHKKGEEVSVYEGGMAYVVSIGDNAEKYDIKDYPHIFKLKSTEKV